MSFIVYTSGGGASIRALIKEEIFYTEQKIK